MQNARMKFFSAFLLLALLIGAPSAFAEPKPTFEGYPCTKDCSGHKAGYEWAQRKGITAPEQCGGTSNSFKEGCKAWAEKSAQQNPNAPDQPNSSPEK